MSDDEEGVDRLTARQLLAGAGSPEDAVTRWIGNVERHVEHVVRQARFDAIRDLYVAVYPGHPAPITFAHGGTMASFAEEAMRDALLRRLQGKTGDEEE